MKSNDLAGEQDRFELPPEVTFSKRRLSDAQAYVFRHRTLGELGRILLQDNRDGHCRISCEVVGDSADPMTEKRAEVFKPLALALTKRLDALTGTVPEAESGPPPSRPAVPREMVESKLIPCDRCGAMVAMLIFAPEATEPGRFEDCARKMYPEYTRLNLPTWILGPALGGGPPRDRPADILKVWPTRVPVERLRPAEFNPLIERLAAGHCG